MDLEADVRVFVERQRAARLASNGSDGRPHVVPIVFVWLGEHCYTAVDEKPKRSRRLQRLRNIEADPLVTLLFDVYDEDWSNLAWVMLRGRALVVDDSDERQRGVEALRVKYPQYREMRLEGSLVRFTPERVSHWGDLAATLRPSG